MMSGWMWVAMPLMMLLMLALFVLFIGAIVWIIMYWVNKNKTNTSTMPSMPPPQSSYHRYDQGYQPPEPRPETYQEGGKQHHSPQSEYEQPQAQYPQEQELPRQH